MFQAANMAFSTHSYLKLTILSVHTTTISEYYLNSFTN